MEPANPPYRNLTARIPRRNIPWRAGACIFTAGLTFGVLTLLVAALALSQVRWVCQNHDPITDVVPIDIYLGMRRGDYRQPGGISAESSLWLWGHCPVSAQH